MQSFNLSVLNTDGTMKSADSLASELCNTFYLTVADSGDRIDPEDYKKSQAMFMDFAVSILSQATKEEPTFTIGMQKMSDDEE